MDLIEWYGDKNELKNVLENAINRKVYFRETKINQAEFLKLKCISVELIKTMMDDKTDMINNVKINDICMRLL